jgi:outer membrane protein assembly factor BamB
MDQRSHAHRRVARASSSRVAVVVALALIGAGAAYALTRPPGLADTASLSSASPMPGSSLLATASSLPVPTSSGLDEATGSPAPTAVPAPPAGSPFPGGVLVADRANGRILAISNSGQVLWRFPSSPSAIPAGQTFTADDAFLSPDGKTIVANDEFHEMIDRIDIATGRIVWQYGKYGRPGSGTGQLHTPDDAYPLANGDIVVADIMNCRIIEIAPDKSIVRQWGKTGDCRHRAGVTFGLPNGDTPLPDGGMLVTEIKGSRVVRLAADGHVVFDIHVPVAYPSDAQLDANGNIVVADFSTYGQVVSVDPTGKVLWTYAPRSGPGALNHPSLATPMANGLVSVNDDFRHRVIVFDPATGRIVWQFGHTDRHGTASGYLNTPDGHQPLPPGTFG